MKKFLIITGMALSIGTFSNGFLGQASAAELEGKIINSESIEVKQQPIDSLSTKEPTDGTNNPSTVNLQVRKISGDNVLSSIKQPITDFSTKSTFSEQSIYNDIVTYGAGEWDYLGSSTFKSNSKIFYSGGGNVLIYIYQPYIGPGFDWKYQLREQDPVLHDTVASWSHVNDAGTYELQFNVGSFVDSDGKSGKAELYLKKLTVSTTSVTSEWYD